LPEFQNWRLDMSEAAARFVAFTREHGGQDQPVLPPGFAEGRPGAFLRATRALVRAGDDCDVQSMYELLQDSPDEQAFRAAGKDIRFSDVLDLTWMVAGPLELRSVQDLLERLCTAALPEKDLRFAPHDEPRYRAALQLHAGKGPIRLAHGGVLTVWPGRPPGVDAAHVRIFLEPWAVLRSGEPIDLDQPPEVPGR
jgi:hypothetical protein